MALTTVKKQNNTLGILGTLASIGGAAFGVPWLGALGTGMQGMNSMMNGDSSMKTGQDTAGALSEVLSSLKDIWKNPAKTDAQAIKDKVQDMTDTELVNRWSRYLSGGNWINGFGSGLQPDGSYVLY